MHSMFAVNPLFAELSFRGYLPVWFVALAWLGAVAAVVVFYVLEGGRVNLIARLMLAAVRVGTVSVLAFLLLWPVWVREDSGERRRPVSVLLDISQSMDSQDPRPGLADQWRVAFAYDLAPTGKGIPDLPLSSAVPEGKMPDKPKRIDVARAALSSPRYNTLSRLRDNVGPLEAATFGARRTGRDGLDLSWIKELAATEPRTAMADTVAELVARDSNDLPAAVVLVTDGRDNASKTSLDDLARECARLKVPLHIYGVGSSAFGQVQLRDAAAPETVFVDDLVAVPVRYRVKGVIDGKAEIVLKYGDREVASKTINPVREGDDLKEMLYFVPTKEDAAAKKPELTATITVTSGTGATAEILKDEINKPVAVVDRKLKVLVVDSLPRFDFKFLQRALLRDRRVDASFYLTEGDKTTMKSGKPWVPGFALGRDEFRKELFEYDLLILGDVPTTLWTAEQQEVVKEFVAEGGGLIHIAGRWHAPNGWVKTLTQQGSPIADVLPVEVPPVKFPIESPARPTGFRPQVVASAARAPILSLEDDPLDNAKLWRTMPELYWHYPVTKLKPAAEVFLVHPKERTADGKAMPLLAGHYYGKGYVLFVGFDETWRWRFNEADKYFGRFWSQGVYVAGVPRTVGTKLTQLSLDTLEPVQGKTGQVYARLFTKDFQPITAEEIEGRLLKLDAGPNDKDANVPVKLVAIRGPDGRPTGEYVATLPFNRTGRFSLKVDPNNGNPAGLDYRVSLPPEHELAPGPMDEAAMRKLAEQTGGGFYREEDLMKLPDDVKPKYVPFTTRTETPLWALSLRVLGVSIPLAFSLLIGLLSGEWVTRKFCGLS